MINDIFYFLILIPLNILMLFRSISKAVDIKIFGIKFDLELNI